MMRRSLFNCWSRSKAYAAYLRDTSSKPDAPSDPNIPELFIAAIMSAVIVLVILGIMV